MTGCGMCSHARSLHGNRVGHCYLAMCGCPAWVEKTDAIPARLDERYDPSPAPIDRSIK